MLFSKIENTPENTSEVDIDSADAVFLRWLSYRNEYPLEIDKYRKYLKYQYGINNPISHINTMEKRGYLVTGVDGIPNRFYITEKGKKLYEKGDTEKNEIINKVWQLVCDGKYTKAWNMVAKYKSKKPMVTTMGIDWNKEKNAPFPQLARTEILELIDFKEIKDKQLELKMKNICIMKMMMDVKWEFIKSVVGERLYEKGIEITTKHLCTDNSSHQCSIEEYISYMRNYASSISQLIEMSDNRYKYYIVANYKGKYQKTCDFCKSKDGKKILVSDAKIGITAPPFGIFCKCMIIHDDTFEKV